MTLPAQAADLVPELDPSAAKALSGGDAGHTWLVPRTNGQPPVLVKQPPGPELAAIEAAGLAWLAAADLPAPRVLACDHGLLALEWVVTATPTRRVALAFGAALARTHASGADAFGVPPPGCSATVGAVGAMRVPYGSWSDWSSHYVHDRLEPTVAAAVRAGGLDRDGEHAVAALCSALLADPALAGPDRPPARIHGDLWAGNVLWQPDRALVIDPAACGGHAETDLGMLHLFGAPHLDDIVAGYESVTPLGPGWRDRIPLQQVFPLLVHAAMFGGGYGASAARAARAALRART